MARGISNQFMDDLQGKGALINFNRLLKLVQLDATLCLCIRNNYINVYYRGGNILNLSESNGSYSIKFDSKYILGNSSSTIDLKANVAQIVGKSVINQGNFDNWMDMIPFLKHEMDLYFGKYPKNEREFQQLMLRENNRKGVAQGTDYFIADIEYADKNGGRFDMLAIHWPSTSQARKNSNQVGLSFIEMKYADGAMTGKSGIVNHINNLAQYLNSNSQVLTNLKTEMQCVFNQQIQLNLIDNQRAINNFNNNLPELIFVLANHDPASTVLRRELQAASNISASASLPFEIKIAVSNFMGYGLYSDNVCPLNVFLNNGVTVHV